MDKNFLAENRLHKISRNLSKRYTKCIAKADSLLVRYSLNFPGYTDHTLLHSVQVSNLCSELIYGHIDNLNEYEIYILLMAALLHDVGMGLNHSEVNEFKKYIGDVNSEKDRECSEADYIRNHHHELSASFVLKNYRECFIPNQTVAVAIAEVCKGHRKIDLSDKNYYPVDYPAAKGLYANLAYIAAVLRLADEMDISESRNLMLQYAGFVPSEERSVMEFQKHRSVKCKIENETFYVCAVTEDIDEFDELNQLYEKLEKTYEYCADIALKNANAVFGIKKIAKDIRLERKDDYDLNIDIQYSDEKMIVKLYGHLNTNSSLYFEKKLFYRLQSKIRKLVLDFKELVYISSAGLRMLLSAQKKMDSFAGEMVIENVSGDIMEIFEMTGFADILKFKQNV